MRNTKKQPQHLFILDILVIIFTGILALTFTKSFQAIGELDDWHYYNTLVEYRSLPAHATQSTQTPSVLSFLTVPSDEESGAQNVSDASSETIALAEEAKQLLYAKFGDQPTLLWERFESLQVKDCDIGGSPIDKLTLAFYEPDENTIYCNRRLMYHADLSQERLHTLAHELMHALLERDKSCLENDTSMFHEGFTEYLSQLACPTDNPSYFLSYCMAEVFVKDNGLNKAIELFMDGKAEESINQRLGKENIIQSTNNVFRTTAYNSIDTFLNAIALDVYFHYIHITGVNVDEHAKQALKRIPITFENLAALDYFNELRTSRGNNVRGFFLAQKMCRLLTCTPL
jgi:hypothetical protein